jgi:hypothetical protein
VRALAAAAILLAAGCSPTARIAASANEIRSEAALLVEHGTATGDKVTVAHAKRIEELAATIHEELPGTADRTPAWLSTLAWVAGGVVAVCIVVVLWQTGIGGAIRTALGWIPRRKQATAELAVDMLNPDRPEGEREFIAALRAQDEQFDLAYRRAQARRKDKEKA